LFAGILSRVPAGFAGGIREESSATGGSFGKSNWLNLLQFGGQCCCFNQVDYLFYLIIFFGLL
jgi:hypothetical protein